MAMSKISAQDDRSRAAAAQRAREAAAAQAAAAKQAGAAKRAVSTPAASGLAPRRADAVTISEAARELAAARKAVGETPDVRADRIRGLKAAVADGSYSVSSRQLASDIARKLKS
jgi:flagellar biosynthesis anti-sigma factor FlgM